MMILQHQIAIMWNFILVTSVQSFYLPLPSAWL